MSLQNALISICNVQDDKLRYEACWSLTNIVSGTSEQTWAAVKAGATQHLVNLSVHPSLNVAEQALWAVANIAGDSSQLRDLVIECRGLEAMLEIARHIDSIPLSFARTLSWAFSNICRHKNPSASLEALRLICQALPSLLNYSDKQVRHDALWAVSYLTDGNDEQISLSVSSGVIDIIFSTLQSSDTQLIAPSLRALGNVCTGNDDLTQYVINLGLLKEIIPLVERVKSTVTMKESTWLLSNILAGTQDQIQAVINAGLLPYLKEVLKSGDYKCQYEAIWALANIATGGTSQQILSMVHEGIVTELSLMLSMKSSEIVCLTLETIYTCLCNVANLTPDVMDTLKDSIEEMGALDKLEELQNSDNDKIYQNAYRIISEFFSDEDGVPADDAGDENQPPTQQYNF
ncbi:hypothetical protein WR25_23445 [Diploscapter pachys]|uniref:Importin subunit alpha n=1 Tax=Diploscapter pachys TaxID=2018661 RepID=A0A2A2KQC8_9BILA|nr:hypothetical protein WR25_23445 [Diploscapter pachys]